nr:cutinase family protein [Mycobacterium sp. 1164966.3]
MQINRMGRRASSGAAALAATTVLLVTASGIRDALPTASAADCTDAEVVFARGTSEPPGVGRVGQAFIDSLRQQTPGMNIGVYAVNYPASRLQLHGGDGANDVVSHVKSMASSCPATKIVLGGYSQGADVIDIVSGVPIGGLNFGSPLPPEYADNVAAVAVFGNVANRAGGSLTSQSAMFGSKAVDLCNPSDPICHAGPGNEWSGHTEGYVPVYTTQAATFVASKLLASRGQQVPGFGSQPPGLYPQAPGPVAPGPVAPGPVAPDAAHGSVVGAPGAGVQAH